MLAKQLIAGRRVQPHFIKPMQVAAVRKLPADGLWFYEAKLDGYRCLVAKRVDGVVLWSHRGNVLTARFAEIARACEKLPDDTLIDGELIAFDDAGRISFSASHSDANPRVQFCAFDILVYRGRSVLRVPLEMRHTLLVEALAKVKPPVLRSLPIDAEPADLVQVARELKLEGIIAKHKGSIYAPGQRTGAWLKYKINRCQ